MSGVCVGIAGGSGSGKTVLVRKLCRALESGRVVVVKQDDYYRDQSQVSPDERARKNYDHPSAIEFDLLVSHIRDLKNGKPVMTPVYDFVTHNRGAGCREVRPGRLVIVEGILVLAVPELRELFDLSVFVDQSQEVRLSRRITRDIRHRGRSRADVLAQFNATTGPMHAAFVEPSRAFADVIVRGDSSARAEVAALAGRLKSMMDASGA